MQTAAPTITVGQPFFVSVLTGQESQETGPSARKKKRRDGRNEETGGEVTGDSMRKTGKCLLLLEQLFGYRGH